jgi:hypothetical protein
MSRPCIVKSRAAATEVSSSARLVETRQVRDRVTDRGPLEMMEAAEYPIGFQQNCFRNPDGSLIKSFLLTG